MSEQAVSRWIRGYERSGDELCVEERLPTSWTLEALAKTLESDLPGDCAYYLEADP
jgi:hypothetical protein